MENPFLTKEKEVPSYGTQNPFLLTIQPSCVSDTKDNPFMVALSNSSNKVNKTDNPFVSFAAPSSDEDVLASRTAKPFADAAVSFNVKDGVSKDNPFLSSCPGMAPESGGKENPFLPPANSVKDNPFLSALKNPSVKDNPFLSSGVSPLTEVSNTTQPIVQATCIDKGLLDPQHSIKAKNIFLSSEGTGPPALDVTSRKMSPLSFPNLFLSGGKKSSSTFGLDNSSSPFTSTEAKENVFTGTNPAKIGAAKRPSIEALSKNLLKLANSLKSVVCTDSEMKYDVLDKIDREIRTGVVSSSHTDTSGSRHRPLKGTCMDMCPERERYFRDDKHQVSPFELATVEDISTLDGNYPEMDHRRAVKEYSRSSADQEEPLPHHLRPAPVLTYTMNYLVSEIMDTKYSVRNDWFDFLWNRTRAIRKDITQQNLSSPEVIQVVEKCARFHIFCSHYLCDHDLNVFEPKMNMENLTKCLQSLKHMYEDRRKEEQEISPNEAEFRCYQILLNLNDGDILREVMQFEEDIQNSREVKFALKVFAAVQDNNYVRFFKLLKSTTFLNACLLCPYFNQVRGAALTTMVRTFCVPNSEDTLYSLENFKKILAFDDCDTAAEFCHHYSLKTTQDSYICFNRFSLEKPEDPFKEALSLVVGQKLQTTMAEIVNNGPIMKAIGGYEPVNSFSDDGVYIGKYHKLDRDAFSEALQEKEDAETEEAEEETSQSSSDKDDHEVIVVPDDSEVETIEILDSDEEEHADDSTEDDQASSHGDDPEFIPSEGSGAEEEELTGGDYVDDGQVDESIMFLRGDFSHFLEELVNEQIAVCIEDMFGGIVAEVMEEVTQPTISTAIPAAPAAIPDRNAATKLVPIQMSPHARNIAEQIVAMTCIEEARTAVTEVIDEAQVKIEKARRNLQERIQMIEEESVCINKNIIETTTTSLVKACCEAVFEEENERCRESILEKEVTTLGQRIITTVINEELTSIASKLINKASKQRAKANRDVFLKKKMHAYFTKWIKAYKRQQFIKSSLIDFPPLPPMITTGEAVQKLHPDGDISYSLPSFSENPPIQLKESCVEELVSSASIKECDASVLDSGKPLMSVIEDGLSQLFFKTFREHCLYCERLDLPPAPPNDVITFYNDVLSAIKDAVSDHFDMGNVSDLGVLMGSLELPYLEEVDIYNWEVSCSACEDFISKVACDNEAVLLNEINNTLSHYVSKSSSNHDIVFPWSEILESCIDSKLTSMHLEDITLPCSGISFNSVIDPPHDLFRTLNLASTLKSHIKTKRRAHFTAKQNEAYKDEMKRKKFTHEHQLRKSIDSVNVELDSILSSITKRRTKSDAARPCSLQNLFNQSTSVIENIELVKKERSSALELSKTLSTETLVFDDKEVEDPFLADVSLCDEMQRGCKRSFEHSIVEHVRNIEEYCMKRKRKEEYWRRVISQ